MNTRKEIIEALEKEIVGPSTNTYYLDTSTREEILLTKVHGAPKSRYGAGMLYPQSSIITEVIEGDSDSAEIEVIPKEAENELEGGKVTDLVESDPDNEEPVGLANQYLPSAMGFTSRFSKTEHNAIININVSSACYERGTGQKSVLRLNKDQNIELALKRDGTPILSNYWIRKPFKIEEIIFDINTISDKGLVMEQVLKESENKPWLKIQIFNRSTLEDERLGLLTLTFVIINCMHSTIDASHNDRYLLFQNSIRISTENPSLIKPYKEKSAATDTVEEKELNLLYRNKRVYSIGHGTGVKWDTSITGVKWVETSVIPTYEIPQVAPAGDVDLSMFDLSDLGNWESAKQSLQKLSDEYALWINELENEKSSLDARYKEAADLNISKCRESHARIHNGILMLLEEKENSDLVKCFRWMNRAMLWQQQRSKTRQRKWLRSDEAKTTRYFLEGIEGSEISTFESLKDFHDSSPYRGRWRPFQLAFILMNIKSVVTQDSPERSIVDLIWFPTGGGKTEAYLGLTAFTIFYRRIQGKGKMKWSDYDGTAILMRYTLRLLTTQQYERASSLICACDLIRNENKTSLGREPISIGLWVGSGSTPNNHKQGDESAVNQYKKLLHDNRAPYNFIVMKCPCCGAQIGKVDKPSGNTKIKGITREDGEQGRVIFKCENQQCEYSEKELPLFVVDEYIYQKFPTLILGTVDKFAMIPWKKEAGYLFGFREDNNGNWSRITPPELIIQDELHLISGPLGTMVGLYETMIQTLCNNYSTSEPPFLPGLDITFIPPKIVASSATISRAREQVTALYGSEKLNIFPAQGLEFGNTWFSKEIPISKDNPGRLYAGILASGYPSAQTSVVRAYSAVLQKVKELDTNSDINYYWTLLGYFNSIRELGGASSLVNADIRERLSQIQNRELLQYNQRRKIYREEELTSRISASEIPEALKKLEKNFSNLNNRSVDICLATNMVATGVDISRLGLIFIHGQPKTTAEYIQASSRVGRDLPKGPGLVFTLYSPSKPRDKSQYEHFQGYHSRIYSFVEATSVTPFSVNARQRALHAVVIGMVRHFAKYQLRYNATTQDTDFQELISKVKSIIVKRCQIIDQFEQDNTERQIDQISTTWDNNFQYYGDAGNYEIMFNEGFVPLMYANSAEVKTEVKRKAFPTPTSMRGVDSESQINV